jgi:hypothetical protein
VEEVSITVSDATYAAILQALPPVCRFSDDKLDQENILLWVPGRKVTILCD